MEPQYVDGIFTLVGVGIGAILTFVSVAIKDKRRQNVIRKALYNELTVVLNILENTDHDDHHMKLPDDKFPFITETYETAKVELASFLKPDDLWIVQKTYARIKNLNEPMSETLTEGYLPMAPIGKRYYQLKTVSSITALVKQARECVK